MKRTPTSTTSGPWATLRSDRGGTTISPGREFYVLSEE